MIRRWSVWDEMRRMQNEMDRVFSSFFSREPFRPTELLEGPEGGKLISRNLREPLSDVWRNDKEITINTETPSIEKKGIMITAKDEGLEVKVQRKNKYKKKDKKKSHLKENIQTSTVISHFQKILTPKTLMQATRIELYN